MQTFLAARAKRLELPERAALLASIDGHHDEQATTEYFHYLLPHLAPEALLLFDDITWTEGMQRAWQAIASHPRVTVALDLYMMGVCIVRQKPGPKFQAAMMYW